MSPTLQTVSAAVYPPAALPVIVASSSDAPSLNTLSEASESCDVATLLTTLCAAASVGKTSKWMCGQRPA